MIIDKKGRLFGKINLLDALIVLIIIAFLAFASLGFFSSFSNFLKINDEDDKNAIETEIIYTVEITKEDEEFFEKINVGDKIYNPETEEIRGEIIACDVKPAKYLTENKIDLAYQMTEVEGKFDGHIKIKADAKFDYPDFTIDKEAIKIGSSVTRDTNEISMSGYIIDIEYDEALVGGEKNDN